MAKKNFYVVRVGRKPGIYKTWDECKAQVDKYPGADFKGVGTYEEAEIYLNGGSKKEEPKQEETVVDNKPTILEKVDVSNVNVAIAYVDGSYNEEKHMYGSGAIILYKGKEYEFASCGNDENLVDMRNVAGEIKASEMAMQWCLDNGVETLKIYHDYRGIADWCTGAWKANKIGTKAYKAFYDQIKDQIDISFVKVKGHSGDHYNDIADRLAGSML
jgi:viroplasmin and RNaseH domain-containing protein